MKKPIIQWTIVGVLLTILVVRSFFFDIIAVKGDSMLPNYSDRDIILIAKFGSDYERYDVVVIQTESGYIIKRIIALPGETVQIKNGRVYIDNCLLISDVVDIPISYAGISENPIVLEENDFFVLGDDREISKDSRYEWIGIIKCRQIVGVVTYKIRG